jgi:hypothetical protein
MNNVTFYPEDIQALFTQFYDGFNLKPIFAGARYNGPAIPEWDEYGRPKEPSHRDVNPGMYFLTVANMVGIQNRPFLEDNDAGPEVWNAPVGQYNITSLERFTLEQGAQKFWNVTTYPFNSNAASLVYMQDFRLRYVLELNSDDEIIGGEWLPRTDGYDDDRYKFLHPDFLWLPTRKPSIDSVSDIGIPYSRMAELLRKSRGATCVEYCQNFKQSSLDDLDTNLHEWCPQQPEYPTEQCYKENIDYIAKMFDICSRPIV